MEYKLVLDDNFFFFIQVEKEAITFNKTFFIFKLLFYLLPFNKKLFIPFIENNIFFFSFFFKRKALYVKFTSFFVYWSPLCHDLSSPPDFSQWKPS